MTRVVLIAAMAGELKPLVRGWRPTRSKGVDLWRWSFRDEEGNRGEWIAAAAGAGAEAATRALAAAEQAMAEGENGGPADALISLGWAGALREDLAAGEAYRVSGVIDARTGERLVTADFPAIDGEGEMETHPRLSQRAKTARWGPQCREDKNAARVGYPVGIDSDPRSQSRDLGHPAIPQELKPGDANSSASDPHSAVLWTGFEAAPLQNKYWLVTSPRVADAAEKQRLRLSYGADLVDMEAAALARLARMRGVPFHCIKGVSDGYHEQLPDFNRFISSDGQFHRMRLVFFVFFRPWYWRALMRMGENSTRAARGMAECVLGFLDEGGTIRKRNGDPDCRC